MHIVSKRFAGKSFNAVQVVPALWRLKNLAVFALFLIVILWLFPRMYEKASEGQPIFYILMIPFLLLAFFFLSRASTRVVVYVDPRDKQFVVVKSGLVLSREKINTGVKEIKRVSAETSIVYDKDEGSGGSAGKTKTALVLDAGKGGKKLWTYSRAENARKAARLVEELLKS